MANAKQKEKQDIHVHGASDAKIVEEAKTASVGHNSKEFDSEFHDAIQDMLSIEQKIKDLNKTKRGIKATQKERGYTAKSMTEFLRRARMSDEDRRNLETDLVTCYKGYGMQLALDLVQSQKGKLQISKDPVEIGKAKKKK
ncbi:MAG: hypothetical protein ACUZ8E_18040 [Candidatus Anammoxibacter sp.]